MDLNLHLQSLPQEKKSIPKAPSIKFNPWQAEKFFNTVIEWIYENIVVDSVTYKKVKYTLSLPSVSPKRQEGEKGEKGEKEEKRKKEKEKTLQNDKDGLTHFKFTLKNYSELRLRKENNSYQNLPFI